MIAEIKGKLRPLKNRLVYGGHARSCPICENEARRFLPFGIVPRADAKCPFCGALERHRLFWLYVQRRCDFLAKPPKKALHVAPEAIIEKKFRKLLGAGYLTADLFDPKADVKMDITDIQFPDGSFDFIYCSHVLEHVLDDRKAMREFRRVLADDGVAILLVPINAEKTFEDPTVVDPKERLRLFGQEDHVRRYGPDYPMRLTEEGFSVETLRPGNFLSPDEIEKMGLAGESAGELYICRK